MKYLAMLLVVGGCATAKADFHAAGAAVLGVLTVVQQEPALLEESKFLLSDLGSKALSPTDKAVLDQALARVNEGNASEAAALLAPLVAASKP